MGTYTCTAQCDRPRSDIRSFPRSPPRSYDAGMVFTLPALGVSFAAFCIWVIIRIVNRREKSRRMIWGTVLATSVLLTYPLSFGPACRLVEEGVMPYSHLETAYQPCIQLAIHGAPVLDGPLWWWVEQWGGEDILLEILIIGPDGGQTLISPFPRTRIYSAPTWAYLYDHFWPCYAGCITLIAAIVIGLWRLARTCHRSGRRTRDSSESNCKGPIRILTNSATSE